jgi:hypothetical protein
MPVAQAIVERGMLDSVASGLAGARYEIEARLGQGSTKWLLIGMVVVLLYWTLRRR